MSYDLGTRPQRFTTGGVLGNTGQPKRVFSANYAAGASTGGWLLLHNSVNSSSTANIYVTTPVADGGSGNYWEDAMGQFFPNGCYVQLSSTSGCTYAVVNYREVD